MAAIQWRPEINALTVPQSYWIRFVLRNDHSGRIVDILDIRAQGRTPVFARIPGNRPIRADTGGCPYRKQITRKP